MTAWPEARAMIFIWWIAFSTKSSRTPARARTACSQAWKTTCSRPILNNSNSPPASLSALEILLQIPCSEMRHPIRSTAETAMTPSLALAATIPSMAAWGMIASSADQVTIFTRWIPLWTRSLNSLQAAQTPFWPIFPLTPYPTRSKTSSSALVASQA